MSGQAKRYKLRPQDYVPQHRVLYGDEDIAMKDERLSLSQKMLGMEPNERLKYIPYWGGAVFSRFLC